MGFWFGKGQDQAISLNCRPEDGHPFSASSRNDNQGSLYSHPTRPNIQKLLFHLWFTHEKKVFFFNRNTKRVFSFRNLPPFSYLFDRWWVSTRLTCDLFLEKIWLSTPAVLSGMIAKRKWCCENKKGGHSEALWAYHGMLKMRIQEPEQTQGWMFSSSVDWSGRSAIRLNVRGSPQKYLWIFTSLILLAVHLREPVRRVVFTEPWYDSDPVGR